MALISSKDFLDIQATIACRFALERDMIITDNRLSVFINWEDFIPVRISVVNFEQVNVGCV